jgi:large subunit ribosomal protein L5
MEKVRLQEQYDSKMRSELQKQLGLKNIMEVPKVTQIVINVGAGKEIIGDSKVGKVIADILGRIAGQRPVMTKARKSIAGFKIREGMTLGAKVTLHGRAMYEFLDRLINVALPTVRDFQGVKANFDKFGNYNLGIKEWIIFPEVDYDVTDKVFGLNVTIGTSAQKNEHAYELLKGFGMPFRKA